MDIAELQAFIQARQNWVYGLLLAYALAKTGPLPMIAGFVSASGALQVNAVLATVAAGTLVGASVRFGLGRYFSGRLMGWFPSTAPWIAFGASGVERFQWWLLPLYRFSKGTFTLVGLGAGVAMPYRRFVLLDSAGALLWTGTAVGVGYSLGLAGMRVQPEWAAYVGLALLGTGILSAFLLGRRLKAYLAPHAQRAMELAQARQRPYTDL